MIKHLVCTLGLILTLAAPIGAQTVSTNLQAQARTALQRGVAFLKTQQTAQGAWSDPRFPGMTALAVWATMASGVADTQPMVDQGCTFLLSCAQPDGGLYVPVANRKGSGLGNYNTCLCVTALHATGRRDETTLAAIRAARGYIASTQIEADGVHQGGFGYDKSSPRVYTDLNNTFYAVDAMARTADVEETRPAGEKRIDIDWAAAKKYILSTQEGAAAGDDQGGFVYHRTDPAAPVRAGRGPAPQLKAYGSMTYAGLLAMLHCKLDLADPRVRSTRDYLAKHWTLSENPGMGNQGLYFYYNIVARALVAARIETLPTAQGDIKWREALIQQLLTLQKADGSWINDNNRFWEGDPVLSTSYALLALEFALGQTK